MRHFQLLCLEIFSFTVAFGDMKNTHGWTPLTWAAQSGHKAVMKILSEIGKVDADLKDSKTLLSLGGLHGHEVVMKLL